MSGPLRLAELITSEDPAVRNRSLDAWCRAASLGELVQEAAELEAFRRASGSLYERVRALFFLYAIHRFHVPAKLGPPISAIESLVASLLLPSTTRSTPISVGM